ncbi:MULTISPECIES: type II secretion system protein GspL [Klebsiella]|uniref:Type II secretion system protein L n=1 Tax=Klebsiella michiganensis (strain ATCC 8724 / DSM 4798 / JCM 20051 / NBRC 3318 / NRRL B-199 / KCTC 1686 / BUCSAV 143 / CCM 1901) TaxID=1006551 RepID=A0A0H3HC70_KLEM8|nr:MULTISPECIES: type II secretion system protein GspL [Klebsiella]AEX03980.1 general secretion pathway protein L [Klebsiella michiganensis KCTC 1686]AHW90651.1 general secretion pathway protein L [Klebsiella michiganensis HKOPL1]MBG2549983.1 type II secretion system protein GspL [Klebsiella michiganensis]MBZ7185336.1 type II secretion system protein GspL [Klebsiella michiganensis]MBZ7230481.1 type II secretion system protein GspL [Klebsiella michiganensis]
MNNHHTFSAAVLIIRLNPDAATAIWRLAAPGDAAQTGEWHPDAGDPTLSLLAQRHPAWVLVPASDCAFHRVTLPAGARRNAQQALAFLLEEQLATEIEESHFALIHRDKSDCAVAVVGREKMRAWQAWCEGLGLNVLALTPDALALPQNPTGWSAVRCGEQWLFRCETCSGMAVETPWLGELLVHWPDLAPIACYSPPPDIAAPWQPRPVQDLLALAASNPQARKICLRQGNFAAKRRPPTPRRWRPTIVATLALLLLWSGNRLHDHLALARQADAAVQASRDFYRQWFKAEKNLVNPRLQMQQHLRRLESVSARPALISRLGALQQIIAETPGIRLRALSFDAARNALQLEISAVSSQALAQFSQRARAGFRVQTGEMKPRADGIEGRLTLEGNDG